MENNNTPRYRMLGKTDATTTCECCGKMNLKLTVALEPLDGGEIRYFGTTCAALAMLPKGASRKAATKAGKAIARDAQIIDRINRWLAAGHDPKRVARGVSATFGRPCEFKRGHFRFKIHDGTFMELAA